MKPAPLLLNVVHRPEMMPEYAETVSAQGANGALASGALVRESLDIFRLQHDLIRDDMIRRCRMRIEEEARLRA